MSKKFLGSIPIDKRKRGHHLCQFHYALASVSRWFAQRYTANNARNFNATNGNLNNNNVYSTNAVQAVTNLSYAIKCVI